MFITYKWNDLNKIASAINKKKLVIVSTDTVPGIISKDAQAIYKIKKRNLEKPLIILISNIEQTIGLNNHEKKVIDKYWPGALTIIKNKIGYRIPNNKNLLKLIDKVGPLYSSSANLSSHPPIATINEAKIVFKDYPGEIILIKSDCIKTMPSTIINLDKNDVLRVGTIDGIKIIKEISKK